jgi:hypothetical protein
MKTKKMEHILQFVDKNIKFKSEFRGRIRRANVKTKRSNMSKTVKNTGIKKMSVTYFIL